MNLYYNYRRIMEDYADARSNVYPLTDPLAPIILLTLYLLMTYIGPRLMKNRRPFKLTKIISVYNVIQIAMNAYLVYTIITVAFIQLRYTLVCQPISKGTSPVDLFVVKMVWFYYFIKLVDLFDTVFIILRKNNRQLSVLHIYHHGGMIIAGYIGVKFIPGGHIALLGLLNCFVHTIMYFYYLLTTFDSRFRTSWWKKHITELQLVQFLVIGFHTFASLSYEHCSLPKFLSYVVFVSLSLVTILFLNFYIKNYIKKSKNA